MGRICHRLAILASLICGGAGCSSCDDETGLSDYYPPLPPTGGPVGAYAGEVTDPSELIEGPARSGLVGDFYIKNDVASFIVQAPTRVIGVIPQGGNIVDAILLDGAGQPAVQDHFGELAMIYVLGRTCEHDRIEIVRDGSAGGAAVLRAIGKSGNNDFINIKGIGALPVAPDVDPDIDDGVQCATTYILAPGSTTLELHHSLFNPGPDAVVGPLGTMADTGGETEGWTNARGFERADISVIASLGTPAPIDYVVYQGPGVAYGVIPRHDTPTVHTQAVIAGVSILLDGNDALLDILNRDKYFLDIKPGKGFRQGYDVVIGRDGADIDEVFRAGNGETLRAVSGRVDFSGGEAAVGARVGVFLDGNNNGQIDPLSVVDGTGQPFDKIVSYMDVGADGTFAGQVPTAAGPLLLRAEVKNVGRSATMPVADTANFTIPSPLRVDFQILDDATNAPIPGRLMVVGDHAALPDPRVFEVYDRIDGIVTQTHAIRGTTTDIGDGADAPLYLPAGGTYRVYASRGTEWSIASEAVTASGALTFRLRHVNPTPGYLATDWHVHQIGSPDANVPEDERVRSAVSAGIEVFAATDHDFVSDLQPVVRGLGVERLVRVVGGLEVTPFAHGHFNTWPLAPDRDSANGGAIDWARGQAGYAMLPGEIFAAMRARGAQLVQVNHPRGSGITEFQNAWSRANVKFDYDARMIYGDYRNASMPNDYLRLPEASLWSDEFNGLEVWNGMRVNDSNGDGVREITSLDLVLRDWLSMLSLGLYVTPFGNSDTHTTVDEAVGMPRTYIRVPDDSPDALASGAAAEAVLATQLGANATPRDVVVTNGPMITVQANAMPALGRVFTPNFGTAITLVVTVTSPDWAEFDTLEVFANATPAGLRPSDPTALVPLKCWTARALAALAANDPCSEAALAPEALTVELATVSGAFRRYQATVTVTLDVQDIATRAGATGSDAWLVFRVRGERAIFPLVAREAITPATQAALLGGDFDQIRAATTGVGVPAAAFTAPVFVDFDGGGYRAPFAP